MATIFNIAIGLFVMTLVLAVFAFAYHRKAKRIEEKYKGKQDGKNDDGAPPEMLFKNRIKEIPMQQPPPQPPIYVGAGTYTPVEQHNDEHIIECTIVRLSTSKRKSTTVYIAPRGESLMSTLNNVRYNLFQEYLKLQSAKHPRSIPTMINDVTCLKFKWFNLNVPDADIEAAFVEALKNVPRIKWDVVKFKRITDGSESKKISKFYNRPIKDNK